VPWILSRLFATVGPLALCRPRSRLGHSLLVIELRICSRGIALAAAAVARWHLRQGGSKIGSGEESCLGFAGMAAVRIRQIDWYRTAFFSISTGLCRLSRAR